MSRDTQNLYRLSGFDASLLRMENPKLPMHQTNLAELDVSSIPGGYSFELFRDTLAGRADALPEFRARLADSRWNPDTPVWVDAPDFDIAHHVHRLEVPAPGGPVELSDIVSRLAQENLDRTRPLWDIWFLEGLGGVPVSDSGRLGMVVRTHHVFADGVTSGDLWSQFHADGAHAPAPARVGGFGSATSKQIVRSGVVRFAKRPKLLVTRVIPSVSAGVAKSVRRARRGEAMPSPFGAPRTPFNGDVSGQRRVAYARLHIDDVKAVKNALGVKVNDVLLAAVSGALRRMLLTHSALPETSLVAMMPVSTYDASSTSRNQMAPIFSRMYTDIDDPRQRVAAIAAANVVGKDHLTAGIGTSTLQHVTEFAPGLIAAVMRAYAKSGLIARVPAYNLSLSNVQSPQHRVLGAPIVTNYPFGPVVNGVGLNVTAATLGPNVSFGFVACGELFPGVWELAEGVPAALEELMDAAGVEHRATVGGG